MELKNLFGEPGKGVHRYRIFGFALVDIVGTLLVAFLIMWFFFKHSVLNFSVITVTLLVLGEFLHYIIGVRTEFVKRYLD